MIEGNSVTDDFFSEYLRKGILYLSLKKTPPEKQLLILGLLKE